MKYEITGVSVPFGGISWNKKETGKEMFMRLFLYLESKRILVNPIEMENKDWCIESVLEIKSTLGSIANGVSLSAFDLQTLRNLIEICNCYLNTVSPMTLPGIIYKKGNKWENYGFDCAMKTFRYGFRNEIEKIETEYRLHFSKVIPQDF